MVIGRRFAWAHLPKTAGDATLAMFQAVPGLVQFADPADSNDKHMPFFGREPEVAGKLLVMNIRRLPAWVLSGAQHQARHGVFPDYRPGPLESWEQITSRTDADDLVRWMTDHGRFEVGRWLRAECLTEDVLGLLDELGELSPQTRSAVTSVGRVNEGDYPREQAGRISADQLARLYSLNPVWAGVERRLYGALPID
ncbi:MAG TPA: hypothetical protein VGF70_03525 [Solirubrobacteraceae bacterium]